MARLPNTKTIYGDDCAQCGGKLHGRFLALNGGALMRDLATGAATPDGNLIGFLKIANHGVADVGAGVTICRDTPLGQYEFYFCSKDCLGAFFAQVVGELA
jgi:hypothetical protein